ncbi:DUF1702 family protein [Planobispora takensis]|uniref:DUF1702 family protein n=1 Tax=Planobispora takensis TaxID=1367882 RepID=UPI001EF1C080|nr:DUF1702 family protein [Planobispora takensis]
MKRQLTNSLRVLRRRILTPDVSETKLENRGFHVKNEESRALLEEIGATFLRGYAFAAEARTPAEAEERLERVPERFRGFAYEGAGMGFAVLDGLPFGGGRKVGDFLAGRGDAHIYMVYVGIGWAMARLPRFRWPRSTALDPLLLWLAHDGYGFHQAYFHTDRYVNRQYRDPHFPWPAGEDRHYANRAIDQGIGRALWFIGGTDVERVTSMAGKFPRSRRADLFSGIGLAATYAGGGAEDELVELRERAGPYRPQLAQGSAFAAEARIRAGLLVPHNEVATRILCGTDPEQAARICLDTRPSGPVRGGMPAYEMWRQRIADQFVSLGGVRP